MILLDAAVCCVRVIPDYAKIYVKKRKEFLLQISDSDHGIQVIGIRFTIHLWIGGQKVMAVTSNPLQVTHYFFQKICYLQFNFKAFFSMANVEAPRLKPLKITEM